MKTFAGCVTAALLALASSAAGATECAPIDGGSAALGAVDAEARLAFIRHVLRDQASRASTWKWAWSGIGVALAAGQYAEIAILPHDKLVEEVVLGTASLYIPLSMQVFPLDIRQYEAVVDRVAEDTDLHTVPAPSHLAPCLVLDRAEEQLVLAAGDEAQRTGAFMQVATLLLNSAYTAFIAIVFRDLGATLQNGIGAFVVGEAEIFTTPTGAVKALAKYRQGDIGPPPPPPRVSWTVGPLGVAPGIAVVATF